MPLDNLQLAYPGMLWLLLPVWGVAIYYTRTLASRSSWRDICDPHLLTRMRGDGAAPGRRMCPAQHDHTLRQGRDNGIDGPDRRGPCLLSHRRRSRSDADRPGDLHGERL